LHENGQKAFSFPLPPPGDPLGPALDPRLRALAMVRRLDLH